MNPRTLSLRAQAARAFRMACLLATLAAGAALTLPAPALAAERAAGAGVVSGIVTNKATGNGLIGARAEIPALNLSALVDQTAAT